MRKMFAAFLTCNMLRSHPLCGSDKLLTGSICDFFFFFKGVLWLSLAKNEQWVPSEQTCWHPLVSWDTQHTADLRPADICNSAAEWCRIAATHHSLNGLIISANPTSFPLSFFVKWQDRWWQRSSATFQVSTRHHRMRPHNQEGKKSLSAVMSKASIFTEQLGVSSQRSDVRIHYSSATANCFKVKVTDLTALYFKWQTQILVVFHWEQCWH